MNTIPPDARRAANTPSKIDVMFAIRGEGLQSRYNLRIYNPSACRSYNGATAARVATIWHESEVIFPGGMCRARARRIGNAVRVS